MGPSLISAISCRGKHRTVGEEQCVFKNDTGEYFIKITILGPLQNTPKIEDPVSQTGMSEQEPVFYLKLPDKIPHNILFFKSNQIVAGILDILSDLVSLSIHIEGPDIEGSENKTSFLFDRYSFKAKLDTSKKVLRLYQYGVKFFEIRSSTNPADFYTIKSIKLGKGQAKFIFFNNF